jgi:photosystem II stability/assembly factor-like uncharacterized protein
MSERCGEQRPGRGCDLMEFVATLCRVKPLLFLCAALVACRSVGAAEPTWTVLTTGIDANLRAVSVELTHDSAGHEITAIWASGSNGVILRSLDEGKTWKRLHIRGAEDLDFRGFKAFDDKTAYAMSSGEGEKSRIYKTTDGGTTWELQYTDKRKAFFLDAIVCDSDTQCFALADPIDGKFLLLETRDGKLWTPLRADHLPAALPGEGAFAASNSALALGEDKELYFVTGGAEKSRVFYSPNWGQTWSVAETPIAGGNASSGNTSSGIFSIEPKEGTAIVAVGGDYKNPAQAASVAVYSLDRGKTWQLAASQPGGYRSAVASVDGALFVAVGSKGTDISLDAGVHWKSSDPLNLNAICVLDVFNTWAVGPNGTIARFNNPRQYEIRNHRNKTTSELVSTIRNRLRPGRRGDIERPDGTSVEHWAAGADNLGNVTGGNPDMSVGRLFTDDRSDSSGYAADFDFDDVMSSFARSACDGERIFAGSADVELDEPRLGSGHDHGEF